MNFDKKEAAIEAILFASGEEVEDTVIAKAIEEELPKTRKILANMIQKYDEACCGIHMIEIEGSYQLATKKEYYDYLIRAEMNAKKPKLTEVMLETLSIVAYKQPVTRLEIEKIRGVKSDHAVNKLIEYNLIKELGRLDAPGRPVLFGTTDEFLRSFGLTSPEELPAPDNDMIEKYKEDAQEAFPSDEDNSGAENAEDEAVEAEDNNRAKTEEINRTDAEDKKSTDADDNNAENKD